MSEQIKTTTIDQLPEAANLDGLYVFGYASKNAVGKRSVKAPITLLKGNKGDTGAAGKDGKDGEVTVEQLNEIINESMKTTAERYKTNIILKLNNAEGGLSKFIGKYEVASGGIQGLIDYGENSQSYFGNSSIGRNVNLTPICIHANQTYNLFFNNISSFTVANNDEISTASIFSSDAVLKTIYIEGRKLMGVDIFAPSITSVYIMSTMLGSVSLGEMSSIVTARISDNTKVTMLKLHGAAIKTILAYGNTAMNNLTFESATLPTLEVLQVYNSPSFTKSNLLLIESKWVSRVGKQTGILKLDRTLYDSLSSEERSKFTDKNITFDIVG